MNPQGTAARWIAAGMTHSQVLIGVEDRAERMRMLASAPLFTLWSDVRAELEGAASEIDRLRKRIAELEASHEGSA